MRRFYINDNGEAKGPYTFGQLRSMWNTGTVTGDTLYCEEGFEEWLHLRILEDELDPPPQPQQSVRQASFAGGQPRTIVVRAAKSRGVYIILGLFLGLLGIHNFYAGHNRNGAWQLIITVFLGWTIVGLFITGIWSLIDICTVTKDGNGDLMT